jgi:hypothetical protein
MSDLSFRLSRTTERERKLRPWGQQLRADRHRGGVAYFLVDTKKRVILQVNVDIEKLARKLDVLEPWERPALTPWAGRSSDPVR